MGYIRIPVTGKGPIIVNADDVLNVGLATAGNYIDFVLAFTGDGSRVELRFFSQAGNLNEQTLIQYNNAVIAAQNTAVVDIKPLPGQEIGNIAYNPV
jgi:hypothetical protein